MLKYHMPEDLLINSRHSDLPVGKVCTVCHIPKTLMDFAFIVLKWPVVKNQTTLQNIT